MSSYSISPKLKSNRVFILQKSELEKRFDPFFYIPELLELEKKVLAKKPKKLRDYVLSVSSGATPKTTESELYYAEKENGVPFLRVQNLSPTGVLEFEDCKYINHETHNGMLKRSQVSAGDLLVKITGVGRMAVASVAPENFEGNINQHVCVIKTGSKEISETLAAFLNSDIGEKLASRRSAGGTRPALDYPALLSIPIIEDKKILEITVKVIEQKQKSEAEAEKLLSSIDDYLLKELGIKLLTPPENSLKNRMFKINMAEISGDRFDPLWFLYLQNISKSKYPDIRLKKLLVENPQYGANEIGIERLSLIQPRYIRITDINAIGDLSNELGKTSNVIEEKYYLNNDDVLIARSGNTVGKSYLHKETGYKCFFAGYMIRFKIDLLKVLPEYLFEFTQSSVYKMWVKAIQRTTGQPNINAEEYQSLQIPVPPLNKQKEITNHITHIRQQAQQLKDNTKEALKTASEEIEKILLN